MDKHFSLHSFSEPDNSNYNFLISNRADDVIGTISIRSYEKDCVSEINGLINDLSYNELKSIMQEFVGFCEKTPEYDKLGQSYYIAKRWVKANA